MLLRWIFFFILLLCGTFEALAQECVSRALKTVNSAKVSAAKKDAARATNLLKQAQNECPTNYRVITAIADLYGELGNIVQEGVFRNLSRNLIPPIIFKQHEEVSGEKPSFVRKKWALIVGVGYFKDERISTLDYAVKDARDFAAVLKDPNIGRFKNVQLLTDEQATKYNIETALNYIAKNADKEDLVVLYFSSHGSSADMDSGAASGQTGYIVTHDTEINNLQPTAFSMDFLRTTVNERIKAERVVAFLDTCYSGETIRRMNGDKTSVAQGSGNTIPQTQKGSRALVILPDDATATDTRGNEERGGLKIILDDVEMPYDAAAVVVQGKGRVVIASSRNNEESWESDTLENGYFTYHLLEAMRQQKGLSNVTQLFTGLGKTVSAAVKKDKQATQTPVAYPEQGINIIIGAASIQ